MVCAALVFQWMKGDRFIRPEMNQHTYLSENGNLYFSEVQAADAAEYTCIVTLTAPPDAVLATSQPLYGNSLGIQLNIDGEGWCSNGIVDTSIVVLRLSAEYYGCTWPSRDGFELRSARLLHCMPADVILEV